MTTVLWPKAAAKEHAVKFNYPVDPRTIVTFTFAEHVAYKAKYGLQYYNGGIDFGCKEKPASSTADGDVMKAGPDASGYGNMVQINHGGGYVSIYAHLNRIDVKAGQHVAAGQQIGITGWTGNVRPPGEGGAHLHFEMRLNNVPFDPMPYLVAKPVAFHGEVITGWGVSVRVGPGKVFERDGAGLPKGYKFDVGTTSNGWAQIWPTDNRWVCIKDPDSGEELVQLTPAGEAAPVDDQPAPGGELSEAEKVDKLWTAHPELH